MKKWLKPLFICALVVAFSFFSIATASEVQENEAVKNSVKDPTKLDIKEINLENGLRIFVLERRASPTFAAYYQFAVGGACDPRGKSGIAHMLEHMMFKGSESIGTLDPEKEAPLMKRLSELWHELHRELDKQGDPFQEADEEKIEKLKAEIEEISAKQKGLIIKNEYDELMTRAGGVSLNASTGNDVTNYFIQLPSNRLELWFRMESDRLLHPIFREFYSERDVVHEERRLRYENQPSGKMYEALKGLMFTAHPYGTPVIGWPRDIQRLTREDAMDYFTTYYSPSNCTMVIVGDVSTSEVERLAKKYFSSWKKQEIPPLPITAEPEQQGEKRSVVEFNAEPRLSMGWVTVQEGHPDQYPLQVLSYILGGLWSSRLDKTVVQKERIADFVATSQNSMKYSGYFSASGRVREGHTASELEAAIEREIQKIVKEGVTPEELERAKITAEVRRVSRLKSNLGLAFSIAYAIRVSGGIDYIEEYEKRLNAVTADQVKAVAEMYLKPSRKNVVTLRKNEELEPSSEKGGAGVTHQRGGEGEKRGEKHSRGYADMRTMMRAAADVKLTIPEIGKDVDRVELPSGITVFIKEDHSAPSVEMSMSWLGGSNTLPIKDLAAFTLASDLLDEGGTEDLDPIALQDRKDELGFRFGVHFGSTMGRANFWSLKRNFEESFDLALDILMKPRFDEERLETIKGQYIERMRRRYENPTSGVYWIQKHIIDGDHPRLGYVPSRKDIETITPELIRKFWKRFFGKDNLYITAVGDFDKHEILSLIEKKLGSWRNAEDKEREYITRDPVIRPGIYVVEKDLPQPAIRMIHHIKIDRRAPKEDHAALEIMNDILGGSGFRSRLMERLRSDEGLTYGIYSYLSHEGRPGVPGSVGVSYQTKAESVAHSINSVIEEFHKIIKERVNDAEVEEQIEAWRNKFIFRFTNDFYSVSRLMHHELDDRPYDRDSRQLEMIQNVMIDDVYRIAKEYLHPENLSICVFGTLTEEDKAELAKKFNFKILKKEEVFTGGYEDVKKDKEEKGS